MRKRPIYIDEKDFYRMISWRRELYKIKIDNEAISRKLQDMLGIRGRGYGDRLIKIGIWLLFIPLLGISDALGGVFIGLGLVLKAFTSRQYSVRKVGSDLKFSIEFIKSFNRNTYL